MGDRKTTSTQQAKPWEPTAAALEAGVGQAQDLYERGGFGVTPYAGDWVADQSGQTLAGQAGVLGVLGQGMDLSTPINAASAVAGMDTGSTIQNSEAMRNSVLESIMPSLNASFAGSGMTGSTLHQANLAKGLTSGMAAQELGIQQAQAADSAQRRSQAISAAQLLPGLMGAQQGADLAPFEQMIGFGAQDQAQRQAEIDAAMNYDMMSQSSEAQALQQYLALLSGLGGQFGTQSGTQTTNPGLMGYLGLGMQGYGLLRG